MPATAYELQNTGIATMMAFLSHHVPALLGAFSVGATFSGLPVGVPGPCVGVHLGDARVQLQHRPGQEGGGVAGGGSAASAHLRNNSDVAGYRGAPAPPVPERTREPERPKHGGGAGEGNRTLLGSLEGYCITTMLRPPTGLLLARQRPVRQDPARLSGPSARS